MKIIRKYLNDYKNPSLKAWVLHFEKTITGKELRYMRLHFIVTVATQFLCLMY